MSEIRSIKSATTRARRTFVPGAEADGQLVNAVDMSLVARRKGNHHAITDTGRLPVVGLGDHDPDAARLAPRHKRVPFQKTSDAELSANRIIERRRSRQIVGPQRHIADHFYLPRVWRDRCTFVQCRRSVGWVSAA